MELTKKDRLMLYNQYEILKLLSSDDEHLVNQYEINQEILLNGYKSHYNDLIEWILDDTSEEVSRFVIDVLNMYRNLYMSYASLPIEDKKQLSIDDIKYKGFDGNNEVEYYSYARFLLETYDLYYEIYNNGDYTSNSHHSIIPRYTNMLSRLHGLDVDINTDLSLEQIKKIINC